MGHRALLEGPFEPPGLYGPKRGLNRPEGGSISFAVPGGPNCLLGARITLKIP